MEWMTNLVVRASIFGMYDMRPTIYYYWTIQTKQTKEEGKRSDGFFVIYNYELTRSIIFISGTTSFCFWTSYKVLSQPLWCSSFAHPYRRCSVINSRRYTYLFFSSYSSSVNGGNYRSKFVLFPCKWFCCRSYLVRFSLGLVKVFCF